MDMNNEIIHLPNGVRFNDSHYQKVWRVRYETKSNGEGFCFALQQATGENGRVKKHPLLGKTFVCSKNGKLYQLTSMNIHYFKGGYYWFAVFTDEKGSSATCFFENINSTDKDILSYIKKGSKRFKLY